MLSKLGFCGDPKTGDKERKAERDQRRKQIANP
jgi:hypothetical protein